VFFLACETQFGTRPVIVLLLISYVEIMLEPNDETVAGLGLTVAALSYGLWTMKTGDRIMSQKMMRVRVAAQSFTVIALLCGVLYQSKQSKAVDQHDT